MRGWTWMQDRRWPPVLRSTIPRASAFLLSVVLHFVVLVLLVVFRWTPRIYIPPMEYQDTSRSPGAVYLSLNAEPARSPTYPADAHRRRRQAQTAEPKSASAGAPGQSLHQQARQATKAITMSLNFRGIYGFNPGPDYQLAVQTSGEWPSIPAAQGPPHFEQLVIVEVTIDTEGRVAEARIVGGVVDATIAQKLLSTIREFKYSPAKRDGVPIPSQKDLVIHIPSDT